MKKLKDRPMYKTVTYFTKTKRPHEVGFGYGHLYRLGCSWNSAQGARRFTAIATDHEIELWNREKKYMSSKYRELKPIREQFTWVPIGKKGREKRIIIYIPNRHQRKHGITSAGFYTK